MGGIFFFRNEKLSSGPGPWIVDRDQDTVRIVVTQELLSLAIGQYGTAIKNPIAKLFINSYQVVSLFVPQNIPIIYTSTVKVQRRQQGQGLGQLQNCSSLVPHPNFLRPESYSSAARFGGVIARLDLKITNRYWQLIMLFKHYFKVIISFPL